MKEIELNEQGIEFLKSLLEEIADNYLNKYSQTYQIIAKGIINKLEE